MKASVDIEEFQRLVDDAGLNNLRNVLHGLQDGIAKYDIPDDMGAWYFYQFTRDDVTYRQHVNGDGSLGSLFATREEVPTDEPFDAMRLPEYAQNMFDKYTTGAWHQVVPEDGALTSLDGGEVYELSEREFQNALVDAVRASAGRWHGLAGDSHGFGFDDIAADDVAFHMDPDVINAADAMADAATQAFHDSPENVALAAGGVALATTAAVAGAAKSAVGAFTNLWWPKKTGQGMPGAFMRPAGGESYVEARKRLMSQMKPTYRGEWKSEQRALALHALCA